LSGPEDTEEEAFSPLASYQPGAANSGQRGASSPLRERLGVSGICCSESSIALLFEGPIVLKLVNGLNASSCDKVSPAKNLRKANIEARAEALPRAAPSLERRATAPPAIGLRPLGGLTLSRAAPYISSELAALAPNRRRRQPVRRPLPSHPGRAASREPSDSKCCLS
jgi:hypothetical protein